MQANCLRIILWIIVDIALVILIIKESRNFKSIRKSFTCKKCGDRIPEIISGKTLCSKCKTKVEMKNREWHHFFLFRANRIEKKNKKYVYVYKSYIKYSIIELIICSTGMMFVTACLLLELLNI